jgi:hypothetical protein
MRLRLVLVVALCVGCGENGSFLPNPIKDELRGALASGPGAIASLDSLGPRDWQTMYLFGPYASDTLMRECVKAASGFDTRGIDERDDIYVLLFRSQSGGTSSMTLSANEFLFGDSAVQREYPRGGASFVVRPSATSTRPILVPAQGSTRTCRDPNAIEPSGGK